MITQLTDYIKEGTLFKTHFIVHQSPVMTEHGFGEFCPHVTEQKCEQNVHRLY